MIYYPKLLYRIGIVLILVSFGKMTQGQIRIKAVGDIMLGSKTPREVVPPENGRIFSKTIGSYLNNAAIIFGNLEGTFITGTMEPKKCSEKSRKNKTCYEFGMPENLSNVLKELGFNALSLDNNHSMDYGYEGYEFTQKLLSGLNIKFAAKKGIAKFNIDGINICIAAFGYSESSNHISNLENAVKIINSLDSIYNIIIVSFHGGAEGSGAVNVKDSTEFYLNEDRGNVFAFAHTVIDAGADLVIGHGPHVLRAMEIYKDKLIAYSMGNFLTYGNFNIDGVKGISGILNAELDTSNGNFIKGELIPVIQTEPGIPNYDDKKKSIKILQKLISADFPGSALKISDEGKIYFNSPDFYIFRDYLRFQSLVHIIN